MSRARITCFGEAMVELSGISDAACRIGVGGDTFNSAVYLARAGHHVSYATAVGDCAFSSWITDALADEGIDTSLIPRLAGKTVGLYAISLDDEGERSFTYWRSQSAVRSLFQSSEAPDVENGLLRARHLYLSGITLSLFGEDDRARVTQILRRRKDAGLVNIFDTNYRARNWPDQETAQTAVTETLRQSSWSLPTFDDEQTLFGDTSPEATLARHKSLGVAETIVKSGAAGALMPNGEWCPPLVPIAPIDTTGAGDSFNGGYLSARLSGHGIEGATRAGHDLAGRVLMVHGAILGKHEL